MFFLLTVIVPSLRYLLTHSMPSPVLQSNEDSCVLKETSCDVDSEVCGNRRPEQGWRLGLRSGSYPYSYLGNLTKAAMENVWRKGKGKWGCETDGI